MNESNVWCYHGRISRDAATKILLAQGKPGNGKYLIRDCSAAAGDYVLSLWYGNQSMHYQIQCYGDNKFGIQDGPTFQGLDSLVHHYQSNSDGLPCKITAMCPGGFLPPFSTLKYGRDTNLHRACVDGNVATVRGLLEGDPTSRRDINARNTQGYTPLHLSCARGDDEIVAMLISAGADVASLDALGRSPVVLVCHAGHASTLKLLILQGRVDIHERSPSTGYVPLHQVAVRGFLDCVQVLLSFKASLNPRAFDDDTPRDVALKHGNTHIVEYIDTIPMSKPRTQQSQWLHQNLDRLSAVEILENPHPGGGLQSGSFLVRSSVRCRGSFILSAVGYNRKMYHYQIKKRADSWFFIDDGPLFDSLEHLVDHYMQYPDGLAMTLKKPIPSLRQTMKLPPIPTSKGVQDSSTPLSMNDLTVNDKFEKFEDDFNRIVERSIANRDGTIGGGQPPDINPVLGAYPTPVIPPQPQTPPQPQQPPKPVLPHPATPRQIQPESQPPPQPLSQPPPPPPPSITQPSQPDKIGTTNSNIPGITPRTSVPPAQTSIPVESLEMGQEIGVGEFGSVLKGIWINPAGKRVEVAMKTLHKDKLQQGEKEFLRESRVMAHLNHPCIVRLLGVCVGPPMVLVTELVKMGALLDYIMDHPKDIQEVDQKVWAAQIAMGMQYLEQKRFVHRDLATRNILLANKGHCKISDFGLSRAVGADSDIYQAQQGGRWPVKWYAPESINYGTFSHKSDVWSYGVTLWEMFTFGDLPYGEKSGGEVIAFVEKGNRLEKPDGCPDHTYSIMLNCWHIDPTQRPTFNELHAIFSTDPEYEDARRYRKANNAENVAEA